MNCFIYLWSAIIFVAFFPYGDGMYWSFLQMFLFDGGGG